MSIKSNLTASTSVESGEACSVQRRRPGRRVVKAPKSSIREIGPSADDKNLYVKKRANAEDEQTGKGYDIFAFRKPGGRAGQVVVSRDEATDAKRVLQAIRAQNGVLPKDEREADRLVRSAIASEPAQYRLYAKRGGWQRKKAAYVARGRVIRIKTAREIVYPPMNSDAMVFSANKPRGNLKVWKTDVAALAADSSTMITMMAAAFAAPLLRLTKRPLFVLNVVGGSKEGKSTALVVIGSVIGIGTEADLPNWNATHAAILELARLFCDSVLPINELAAMKGKKLEQRGRIQEITYAFAEGRDTVRHTASRFSTVSGASKFSGILVSTSEQSLHDQAEVSGGRAEGELARAHDVPARPNSAGSIFDLAPGLPSRNVRLRLAALRKSCERNHGQAIEAFVRHVAQIPNVKLRRRVERIVEDFVASLSLPATDLPLKHAAANFGLLLAGATIAIDAGVLPWAVGRVRQAIGISFEGFRKISRREDSQDRARKCLRLALKDLKLTRVGNPARLDEMPRIGFRTRKEGRTVYVISSKAFSEWFTQPLEAHHALRWLHEKGFLRTVSGNKPVQGSKAWAETTLKISGNKKVRVVQFLPPFASA